MTPQPDLLAHKAVNPELRTSTMPSLHRWRVGYAVVGENIDKDAELKKLEEELTYTQGFLQSVMKKLSNERFVNGAPEKVVAIERQKQERR